MWHVSAFEAAPLDHEEHVAQSSERLDGFQGIGSTPATLKLLHALLSIFSIFIMDFVLIESVFRNLSLDTNKYCRYLKPS